MKELERSPIVGKSIEINIQQNEVKTVYFIGYIDDGEWKKAEEIYVELHAVSFTKKMDIKKKKSSFQRIGIKYFKLIEAKRCAIKICNRFRRVGMVRDIIGLQK